MSPSFFFDSKTLDRLNLPSRQFSESQFKGFLNALSITDGQSSEKAWYQPFQEDRYIWEMAEVALQIAFAFVKNHTIISDDDQYRLSSKANNSWISEGQKSQDQMVVIKKN